MAPVLRPPRLRVLRQPWLHFLVIGGVAFAATPAQRPEVRISPAAVGELRAEWREAHGRAPSPAEEQALVDRAIDEALLVAEAWASGWPERDPVVVERRGRIARFVDTEPGRSSGTGRGAEAGGSATAEEERARSLGLDRADPVIRRYLAERMRLAIESEVPAGPPHALPADARPAVPERLDLHHVLVASGPDAAARAAALGRRLAGLRPEEAAALGDPFPGSRHLVATPGEIDRQLGAGFAGALEAGREHAWQGPVPSPYGLHWVWIEARRPARPASPERARLEAARRALEARRAAHLRERLDALRAHYRVRVGEPG